MEPVPAQQVVEVAQVGPECLRRHCGILPAGVCGLAQPDAGQAGSVCPDAPQPGSVGLVGDHLAGEAAGRGHQLRSPARQQPRVGVGELDEQPALAGGQRRGRPPRPAGAGRRRRCASRGPRQLSDVDGSTRGMASAASAMRAIADHDERGVRQVGDEPDARAGDDGEGTLAADEETGDVEAVLGQQVLEAVAGNLPAEPAELGADDAEIGRAPVPGVRQGPASRDGGLRQATVARPCR